MSSRQTPFNILLMLTDQQRWDSLGCYGTPGVHTPNLDRLARQGRRFDNCYVNNTVCTPSRASLWTGLHVPDHGVRFVHDRLAPHHVLFPHRLRELGYDTALIGKLHVSGHAIEREARHPHDGFRVYEWAPAPHHDHEGPFAAYGTWLKANHPAIFERVVREKGMARAIPIEAHLTTWAAQRTIHYLQSGRDASKPFFCCMSVFDPHSPYWMHPPEMEKLLDVSALPQVFAPDEPFNHRPASHRREREHNHLHQTPGFSYGHMPKWRVGYHAAVALIDMQVGRVLDALDRAGLAENTLVLFASDHGDMLGDHGLAVKGGFFYEPCARVPMLARGPCVAAGSSTNAMVQLHDIAATCLRVAGAGDEQLQQWMPEARDLFDEPALRERGHAVCAFRNSGVCISDPPAPGKRYDPPIHATMWREDHWKLDVYHGEPPAPGGVVGELYDLAADPMEMRSLWRDPAHAPVRERLCTKLDNWLVRHHEPFRVR